jgi:hypothetical protein
MLNFSIVETIQILRRRRAHFEQVAAGLATLDDIELLICKKLVDSSSGRKDDDDFAQTAESHEVSGGTEFECKGSELVLKQMDTALALLRLCMFDDAADDQRISSELNEAKAREAIAELDPRLFAVRLLSPIEPKRFSSEPETQKNETGAAAVADHRMTQFNLHEKLFRRPDLPPVDSTSSISFCIAGWQQRVAREQLVTSPSPSLLPAFLHSIESSQPCIYGARRRESSTWKQKHKR